MSRPKLKNHFTVGIVDDVTHTSLAYDADSEIEPDDVQRAVFFGLGADGTVGANKNSIKIIGEETHFLRSGLLCLRLEEVRCHDHLAPALRSAAYSVGVPDPLANFVACHQFNFLEKFPVLDYAKPGAVFLLNSPFGKDEVWDQLPREVQEQIIRKKLKFYVIDALQVGARHGHGCADQHHHAVVLFCRFRRVAA